MTAVRMTPAARTGPPTLAAETRRLAAAILLGLLAALALQVWIVGFLGQIGPQALYARAIYAPIGFIALAVHEGLAVVAQIDAGICRRRDRPAAAAGGLTTLVAAGAGLFLVLAVVIALAGGVLLPVLGVDAAAVPEVATFLALMSLANGAAVAPVLCTAVLRGLGQARLSSLLGIAHVAVAAAVMLILQRTTSLGAQSVPVGYLFSTLVIGLVAGVVLVRRGIRLPGWRLRADTARDIGRIGMPVAGSFLLLALVSSGYLHVLRGAHPDEVAGFGLGQILQTFLIVPATALGSAAAIAVTGRPAQDRTALHRAGLGVLLRLTAPVYLIISAVTFLARAGLVHLVTASPDIAADADDYLWWVAPTLVLLGPTLAVLTYLEQIGRAGVALVLNGTFFAVVLGVALALPQPVSAGTLVHLIAAANVVGFCGVQVTAARLLRQPGKEVHHARHRRQPARHRRSTRERFRDR